MTVQEQPLDFNGSPPGGRAHAATRMPSWRSLRDELLAVPE